MVTGYVRSKGPCKGLTLSGKQVSKSLRRVNPSLRSKRFAPALIFPRPKMRKVHRTWGKPYRNACYAG